MGPSLWIGRMKTFPFPTTDFNSLSEWQTVGESGSSLRIRNATQKLKSTTPNKLWELTLYSYHMLELLLGAINARNRHFFLPQSCFDQCLLLPYSTRNFRAVLTAQAHKLDGCCTSLLTPPGTILVVHFVPYSLCTRSEPMHLGTRPQLIACDGHKCSLRVWVRDQKVKTMEKPLGL